MSTLQRLTEPKKYIEENQEQFAPRLMTTAQLAHYLGMHRGSVYNAIAKGNFPFKPVPLPCQGKQRPTIRWDRRAVDKWIDAQVEGR